MSPGPGSEVPEYFRTLLTFYLNVIRGFLLGMYLMAVTHGGHTSEQNWKRLSVLVGCTHLLPSAQQLARSPCPLTHGSFPCVWLLPWSHLEAKPLAVNSAQTCPVPQHRRKSRWVLQPHRRPADLQQSENNGTHSPKEATGQRFPGCLPSLFAGFISRSSAGWHLDSGIARNAAYASLSTCLCSLYPGARRRKTGEAARWGNRNFSNWQSETLPRCVTAAGFARPPFPPRPPGHRREMNNPETSWAMLSFFFLPYSVLVSASRTIFFLLSFSSISHYRIRYIHRWNF